MENPTLLTPELIAQSMSFTDYLALTRAAVAQGKTTGQEQSAFLADLTKDNLALMERTSQTRLSPDLVQMLQAVPQPQLWLVLTEAWCGDAAVHVPVLAALADQTAHVDLRLVLRSEHPDLMDAYLTNGGKSIPKLIALHADTLQPLGTWGPRPQVLQEYVLGLKQQELPLPEFIKTALRYSEENQGQALQAELLQLLPHWIRTSLA